MCAAVLGQHTPSTVKINGNTVDFGSHAPNGLFSAASPALDSDYIVLQTKTDLSKAELRELNELGADLQEYYGQEIYLFHYTPTSLKPLLEKGFVLNAVPYWKGLKINSHLKHTKATNPQSTETIHVVLHERKSEEVNKIITDLASRVGLDKSAVTVDGNKIEMTVSTAKLDSLADIDSVRTIEQVPEKVIVNNVARDIMSANVILNDTSYTGKGQTVAVADTGLDTGNIDTIHPAFKDRVKELIPLGRSGHTEDQDGHGTHVCGSVLGGQVTGHDKTLQGVAPGASLVLQSLLNDKGGLFPQQRLPLSDLFTGPYKKHQAYIHSNSWGSGWTGNQLPYNDESREIDTCVWENPDLLICFAAGNDGGKLNGPTLGSQAAAKNCLTVGATESTRPSIGAVFNPQKQSHNDPSEISFYSSRGPTVEGRFKPDLVAPGTAILSTRSSLMNPKALDAYGPSPDPLYKFSSGTSMATPLVSGCAAVLREVLVKNGIEKPSAALLKALLINGAFTLHHAHSAKEGFGRVNLNNAIILPNKAEHAGFVEGQPLKDRGESRTIALTIPPASALEAKQASANDDVVTLKVTLVYTDRPGEGLQNDLNLIVKTSDGIERHGNMGTAEEFDRYNNVEQIVWRDIPQGKVEVTVKAARVLTDQQDYALVWRVIRGEE